MIDEITPLIQAISPQPFALIEEIAELAALTDAPASVPAAYAFIEEEAAIEPTFITGTHTQQVVVDFAVLVVTSNFSDGAGGAASAEIGALIGLVVEGLIGKQTASMDDRIVYVGGKLVRARGGYVWWQLTFTTSKTVRET